MKQTRFQTMGTLLLVAASTAVVLSACSLQSSSSSEPWSGTWTGGVTYINNAPLRSTFTFDVVQSGDSLVGTAVSREYNPNDPSQYDITTTAQVAAVLTTPTSAKGSLVCVSVQGHAFGSGLSSCKDINYDRTTFEAQMTSDTTAIGTLPDFVATEPAMANIPLTKH